MFLIIVMGPMIIAIAACCMSTRLGYPFNNMLILGFYFDIGLRFKQGNSLSFDLRKLVYLILIIVRVNDKILN